MKFDLEYIKQMADVMEEKSLIEVSLEDGGQKILLKKGEVAAIAKPVAAQPAEAAIEPAVEESKVSHKATPITSPMVGTFYSAASPDAEPYVKVGDFIKPGQVVCIIEAMKLMNEIEADLSGRVVEICVENGQTIEFGQILMYVE